MAAQKDQAGSSPAFKQHVSVSCPRDGTIVESDDLTWIFSFPADGDTVLAVVRGTLNQQLCPLCKRPVLLHVPLVTINQLTKCGVVALAGIDPNQMRAQLDRIGTAGIGFELVPNYLELRAKLLTWILDYMTPILTIVLTGQITLVDSAERKQHLLPLRLRLLQLFADGYLRVEVSLPDDMSTKIKVATGATDIKQGIAILLPRQVAGTIHLLLKDLLVDAIEVGGAEHLQAEIESRLPPDAIGDLVLKALLADCAPFIPARESDAEFLKKYLYHLLNAMVHARAGRANPQSKPCAEYLEAAWRRSREGPDAFPRLCLPPASSAPKFIRFEDLWDVSMGALGFREKGFNLETSLKRIHTMMVEFGFEERFTDALSAAPFRVDMQAEDSAKREEVAKAFVQSIHAVFFKHYSFSVSIEQSIALGTYAGGLLRNLITNGMTESAIELATRLIDDALQAKDFVAAFSIGGSSIEELNRASAWNEAAAVAGLLTDKFTDDYVAKQLSQAGGGLTSSFWNEAGNTLRYLHYYEQALSAYHISRNFLPLVKDKDDREAREGIVAVNEGRVYRDLRQYGPALQRLTDRVRAHPEDAEAHHGLAILYVDINRFADAAREVDAAIAATDRVVEPRRHANLLITRAVIRMRTGLTQEGAADLNQADNLVPADAEVVHLQIASAAAMLLSKTDSHSDLIERAENRLWAAIRRGSVRNLPIVLATALCALGTLLIEGNRLDDLRRLDRDYLGPVLRDRDAEEWPWQLLYLKARIERALNGDEASWPWLRAALDRVDADTPADGEVGVSVTWLADKDDFQAEITQLAVDLVNRQAVDASELLRVYEFANGRALGVRLARRAVAGDFEATIPKRLAAMAKEREREIVIFLFIDTNEAIHVIQLSSSDPTPRLIPEVSVSAERTRIIGRQFMSAIARANPVALDHLDRDLQPWWSFAGELGTLLVGRLVPDCEVYFLPGRGMAALPLHLLPLGNGRLLIERHSVVFAPNLALLFDERLVNDQDGNNGRLVVSVTKTNDTAEFRNRIDEASRRLLASCETTSRPALHLDGIEAAKKTVIDALAHCDEAFFLCHGTHGGRIKGYGICLADGLQLPPPLLAVDDAPDYARFVLGWDDLDELAAAPALVVSVACSTGRIVLASGGIRLGLEQTLFSRGTRTIVSPMWDVDQVASLAWINSFEAARQASSTKTLADAYRTACLETKKVYSHPFFWAPFVITGPLD